MQEKDHRKLPQMSKFCGIQEMKKNKIMTHRCPSVKGNFGIATTTCCSNRVCFCTKNIGKNMLTSLYEIQ